MEEEEFDNVKYKNDFNKLFFFLDKDFPDRILVENERYYLARCGLHFETVMFGV